MKSLKSINDLLEEGSRLVLGQTFLFLQVFLEVATITVLHDDADALIGVKQINKSDDIIVLALLEDFDFGLHKFLELGGVYHQFFRDDFNSHLRIIPLIDGLIDLSPRSLAQGLEEIKGFELNPL